MPNLKGKRVFISGGAGVIGRELVQLLVADGAIVMVGDLVEIPADYQKQVIYRRGDLNYITQQELNSFNPEVFFHLAATFERSAESYEHWEENFWHNIRLSNYLMTAMRNVPGVKRVVNASSYLIYNKELYNFDQPQAKAIKLKETDPINPRNLTGLAKLAHEIELGFLSKFNSDKFSSTSARIYRGYGKNSRDVISRWVRDLLDNKKITVYKQEGWFDYIYAGDTAKGLYKLACIDSTGIVNLGTGRSRQVKDVVEVLKKHFPRMEVEYGDLDIQYEASEADITEFNKLTNWQPERYLEDVIPELIDFEKNRTTAVAKNEIGNVLITSVAKKVPLVEAVKKAVRKINGTIKVLGADMDAACLSSNFTDGFWTMPRLSNLPVADLITYCKSQNICLIIPTRDGELAYFSKAKEELVKAGINVMVSDFNSINRCLDKLLFSNERGDEILAIPSFLNIDESNASYFVVKERYGAGLLSIGINLDKESAINHSKKLQNPIFQPCVLGNEVSIDAYITRSGDIKGIVLRKRDVVVNGESQITSTFIDEKLQITFSKIIENLNLYGHIILQALIDEKGNAHVIECNARFGGASTLAVQAGLDSFYWAYIEAIGESLENCAFYHSVTSIKQVRHPHDSYL